MKISSMDYQPALIEEKNYRTISVDPITGVIGARITGVDISKPIPDDTWDEIKDAYHTHQVVFFPNQIITHEQHLNFSRGFGEVIQVPRLHHVDDYPDVQIIRRSAADVGRVVGENWHSDSTFLQAPPAAVIMRAVDVPPFGGDTGFTSMYAAYETLSEEYKRIVESLDVVHSGTRIFGSIYHAQKRKFSTGSAITNIAMEEGDRETLHPMVCRHPATGRKFLYVNKTYVQRIHGFTQEESDPILHFLYDHCSRFDLTCRVRWKKNQVLIWDNRATMHRAITDYVGKNRFLTRVTIGDKAPSR